LIVLDSMSQTMSLYCIENAVVSRAQTQYASTNSVDVE